MAPLIAPGNHVRLQFADITRLRHGDIIAFLEKEHLVVHRLVKKKKTSGDWWFCQKGDNLSGWKWVHENQVVGRVASIQKNKGTLNLTSGQWRLINLVLGWVEWILVTLSDWATARTIFTLAKRRMPVISMMYKLYLIRLIGLTRSCLLRLLGGGLNNDLKAHRKGIGIRTPDL